jgi:uncharacterized membrane protein
MLNFTRRVPFFSKKLSMGMWQSYLFDGFFLLLCGFLVFAFGPDFAAYNSHARQIAASAHDITILGVIGIYAVRISTFVAIARRNRQPQVLEWWITIIGLSFTALMFLFGGFMEVPYAAANGYEFCSASNGTDIFVKRPFPCPAPPQG